MDGGAFSRGCKKQSVPLELSDTALEAGLDLSVVDSMFSGRVESYIRISELFIKKGERNIAEILRFFSEGDISRFVIETHGVKGASANLGMAGLSESARELEMLGKTGEHALIADRLPGFEDIYRRHLDSMATVIAQLKEI